MYILKVRQKKKNKIVFEKEFDDFKKVMEKFDSIDFNSGKYRYSIYKDMSLKDILKLYAKENQDNFNEIFKELNEVINDLMKEGK